MRRLMPVFSTLIAAALAVLPAAVLALNPQKDFGNEGLATITMVGSASVVSGVNTPEEFAAQIRHETELVGQIVKTAGIQPIE